MLLQVSKETHRREEADSIWEAQCTLTLWLAQLVLIPFDLAVVDSSITQHSTRCICCCEHCTSFILSKQTIRDSQDTMA